MQEVKPFMIKYFETQNSLKVRYPENKDGIKYKEFQEIKHLKDYNIIFRVKFEYKNKEYDLLLDKKIDFSEILKYEEDRELEKPNYFFNVFFNTYARKELDESIVNFCSGKKQITVEEKKEINDNVIEKFLEKEKQEYEKEQEKKNKPPVKKPVKAVAKKVTK